MVSVIDASVAIKWFVVEPGREAALEVLRELIRHPGRFAVPELFFFEIANIFNRLFPNPSDAQKVLLNRLLHLGLVRFSMTDELLEAVSFFQKHGLSGYDAAYLALAKMLKGTWLTFDQRAHRTVEKFKLSKCLA